MNEWVFDLGDIIFNNIEEYVTEDIGSRFEDLFFTSSDINEDEPSFPAVLIKELPSSERGMTLDNDGINAVLYSTQIEVYSNKSQGDCKRVMKSIVEILKQMQFTIYDMPSFDNTDVYRMVIRARRMIGGNDIIQ